MASQSLSHDAWAAIGQYLGPVSLFNLSSTCTGLYHDIRSNNALWQAQAERRWPGLLTAVGDSVDWHRVYHAAHRASYDLATQQPWTASITSTSSIPAPRAAQLLVLQNLAPMQSVASSDSSHAGPAWHATTVAAAAIAGRLHWWRWSANTETDLPYVNAAAAHYSPCEGNPDPDIDSETNVDDGPVTAWAAAVTAAQAHGRAAQHWSCDSLHGHKAPVTALIDVPTGGPLPGFASGSQDTTIKLWTPLTSSSSRSTATGGPIRPSRTFCSHTDKITALACLQHSTDAIGVSSAKSAPILVSASADRTIKLWSLAAIQQTQPTSGSSSRTQQRRSGSLKQEAVAGDEDGGGADRRGNSKPQQQARNPLLGTLRGHSGPVTSLLAWPVAGPAANSQGPVSGLLSGSDDSRLKLWDVSEGRRACAATWRLQMPCKQLLSGLDLPCCAVAVLPNGLQVVDTRVPSGGSAPTRGVLTLPWSSSNLTTAAAAGMTIAAGGREGVRAWDVRMASSTSSTSCSSPDVVTTMATGSSDRASGRWPLLLSGALPGKAPVTYLRLDRIKVVAASSRPQLGCAAGVAVWSLATGQRVDLQSSCLSGIHCSESRAPDRAAALALDCAVGAGHMAMRELLRALPTKQRAKADAFFTGMDQDDASSDGDGSELLSEDLLGIDAEELGGLESVGDLESEESVDGAGAAGFRRAGTDMGNGVEDCVEPGALAMDTSGPILACIDTLGNLLLKDYTSGLPSTDLVRQHGACNSSGMTGQSASCSNDAEGVVCDGKGQEGSALTAAAEPEPPEDVAGQLARLKFWRS